MAPGCPQGLPRCCCWTQKVLGDSRGVFVPAGIGTSTQQLAPTALPAQVPESQQGWGQDWGVNCPSFAPTGINPQPQTGQKRTEGNCSVKAMQGPSSNDEKGTRIIPRFPGPYPDQGRSLTSCASSLPKHRVPGPGTAVSPPRDSSSSWQGKPPPSPPPQPDPSQGLEGKLRHEGKEEQP